MRLSLITQDFPPEVGGIETYAFEISTRLNKWCDYFNVYAPDKKMAAQVDNTLSFPVHRCNVSNPLLALKLLPGLPYDIYRNKIDICLHTQWQSVLPSILARRISGRNLKIFASAHARELLFNPFDQSLFANYYNRYRSKILHQVDHWFPVSSYTRDLLLQEGIPKDNTTVIHNGTDPDTFHPFDASSLRETLGLSDRKILLTITRLVLRKGIDNVIEAVDLLRENHPDIAYVIVGDGPQQDKLQEMVRQRNLESHVFFMGRIEHSDLPRYYNCSDLFVMPSKTEIPDVEGFGIVFLEANACGKPVVGSRSGGIPDAVVDNKTGILVEENNENELANVIDQLINNPEWSNQLGENGRKRVEASLNWDAVSWKLYQKMNDLYLSL